MAIEGGMRDRLEAGMKLVARYKGTEHITEVVKTPEGKIGFRLADAREFKSPSAAGSAVMGGEACNGWRFWSIAVDEPMNAAEQPLTTATAPAETGEAAAVKVRPQCERCGKQFVGAAQLAHHDANADRLCGPK